jgi:hypothetical protein
VSSEPQLDVGKIVNHTHVLDIEEIRQIIEQRVLAELGEGTVERVEPVHAAPAQDSKLLTKAARAWREAEGEEIEFTEDQGNKIFWFGARYTLRSPDDRSTDDEVPSQWPPEGSTDGDEGPDPQIAEQLDLDEDGFGEIREE